MLPKAVAEYLRSHRQQQLEKLFELLGIASIANRDDGSCDKAADWLVGHLRRLGLEANVASQRDEQVINTASAPMSSAHSA